MGKHSKVSLHHFSPPSLSPLSHHLHSLIPLSILIIFSGLSASSVLSSSPSRVVLTELTETLLGSVNPSLIGLVHQYALWAGLLCIFILGWPSSLRICLNIADYMYPASENRHIGIAWDQHPRPLRQQLVRITTECHHYHYNIIC